MKWKKSDVCSWGGTFIKSPKGGVEKRDKARGPELVLWEVIVSEESEGIAQFL